MSDALLCNRSQTDVLGFVVTTPIGDYKLLACDDGVHLVDHISSRVDQKVIANTKYKHL